MDRIEKQNKLPIICIASAIAALVNNTYSNLSEDEQLVIAALRRSSEKFQDMSLADMGEYLRNLDVNQLKGLVNNVKGIYHELRFVHRENADGDEEIAMLYPETNHPGADVILMRPGEGERVLQLKATDDPSVISKHMVRYPDIPIAATEEGAEKFPNVPSSGFSNAELAEDVNDGIKYLQEQGQVDLPEDMATGGLIAAAMHAGDILSGKVNMKEVSINALAAAGVAITTDFLSDLLLS